ncbi:hypothetical protein OSB04_030559 [Centaurea solstitialis]|uniref:Sugar phosphate transporter domain-containing protein n=1 Tax=Centaurea solstitialis TaxID=347529 RepID=A0AA38SKX5_9ASTR|nr:hypothetical protein OSB04_030559 [Centaurea solstitialis]
MSYLKETRKLMPSSTNDHMRNSSRKQMLTYSYLLVYIALSSGQIFFNKWVLSSKEINFPYPLGLTLLHMVFSSVLCFILKVTKLLDVEQGMTFEIYTTSVFPIGAMFAVTLWLGNTAYLYISISFAQMLKAIMPVAVFILGVAAGLEAMSGSMLLIMSVISFGVLVASYGEIDINWVGVVYQMGGVVGEALRLIFMEILVKRKGVRLNPISMIYYVSPCRYVSFFLCNGTSGTWDRTKIGKLLNCPCYTETLGKFSFTRLRQSNLRTKRAVYSVWLFLADHSVLNCLCSEKFCPCEQNLGSLCSAVCLFVPWIFLEMPRMESWSFHPFVLTLNSLCTFALNLSVFLVIQHTSALTIRVAGVVKDWVVVLLSAILFDDTKLSMINLFGYAIAIAGVAAYNNYKLKKEACEVSLNGSKLSPTGRTSSSPTSASV